ncbi:Spectrin beta chain [Trichinella pseudospiralis]|uniref:Spectrin beta chain n=1 Tax=Trichinella pseudospiralis TaxID=6337 RepID=A0A0V0XXB1_TRIPS|nr:Spectrin beta chain [Trichinella pseudospiralis]
MNKPCEYLHINNAHDSRAADDSRDNDSSLLLLSEEDLDLYTMDKIVKMLKDERENVQKKTFTKWVNSHLERAQCRIQDLYTDLRDGKMLIKLLEILSGERLPKPTKGKMRIHCLENVDKALQFLRLQHVHLENMGSHDIVDGNPRLSLGLIWTIILRFQIQGIELFDTESQETRSAREALLLWCQMKTAGYPNVNVRNFTTSWRDGLAFNALIHKHRPDLISFEKLQRSNALHNLKNAFEVAENQLGITSLLDAEDVNVEMPDEKSIITYLVSYYHYFNKLRQETIQGRRIGKVVSELMENDVMIEEYERLSSDLLQWIKKTIEKLNDRVFVNSLVGVQKQLTTFNNYRTEEKPPKFVSKGNLEVLLFTLQSRMRANNQKPYLPREGRMISDINKAWENLEKAEHERELALKEELIRQEKLEQLAARFDRKAGMRETWLAENQRLVSQDNFGADLPSVEAATKKHEAIETDIYAYEERVQAVIAVAQDLEAENYNDIARINARKDNVLQLWNFLLELLMARRVRLELSMVIQKIFQDMIHVLGWMEELKARMLSDDYGKHLMGVEDLIQKHQLVEADQFLSDCEELRRWIEEKMIRAQDETYRDAKTVHSKFMRHQAFEAEIQSNKERLQRLQEACVRLIAEKPQLDAFVDPHVAELTAQFDELESKTKEKGQRLFDANREAIYVQACEDMTEWVEAMEKQMGTEDVAQDLATVNVEIQKQQLIESEMLKRVQQVCQLQAMEPQLEELRPEEFDAIKTHRLTVQEKFSKLQAPLEQRRQLLERKKEAFQFLRDVEDEKLWIADRRPMARSPMLGDTLFDCHRLQKQNQSLKNEIENHQPWIQRICDNGRKLIASGHENAPDFEAKIKELLEALEELKKDVEKRRERLAESEKAHRYIYDANEAEVWMSEQELYMMTDDRGRDEFTTENLIKKHERQRQDVEQFADTIRDLADRAQKLIAEHAPMSDTIAIRQAQIDKSYAGLQDLSRERRHRLGETLQLFNLHRQIEDILQWIAEREVVAGSQDAGQDYEHVQMLQERFRQFAKDTETIGTERVSNANEECDQLMAVHHPDAPTVALWKDNLNEAWENLLELMQTRAQMLDASCQLHKFFHDCRDTLSRILEKSHSMPEDLGRDASSVSALQRKHQNFLTDLLSLESQVKQVQADARSLQASYAGDRALEIQAREGEVLNAWRLLQANCEGRRTKLLDTSDLFRFMQMVRDLLLWMEEVKREMNTQERPKDVSGVELLMNNHQSLKAEIDAREENFSSCIALGRDLLSRKHYASSEIEKKLIKLTTERAEMMRRWEDRWEYLQLILEVYQFARDAAVADAWLLAQEPYLLSKEYGRTLEEVVKLIKKHEAFEKSTIAQEERFQALEKLTTLELRAQEYLMWLRMGNRLALADMAQCGLRFMEAMESEMFELKELQRRQDEQERLRRTGSPRTSTPTRSPEKLETTFPAESGARTETTLGVDEERRRQLHSSESPGWRISLSRSKYFDANDSVGTESAEGFEGHLIRKHTWETLDRKASIRSWDKLYCVIRGNQLEFYKDHKHREDGELYRGETPINLIGWNVEIASSYTKRRNVLSLRSPTGFEYLLQARDEDDMLRWLHQLRTAIGILETSTSSSGKASTLPAAQQPSAKKRFFGTLKKKQAL